MYKTLAADKDTYITDKIIRSERKVTSSVGSAATLDLFKIYTNEQQETVEKSRILLHFDLEPLRTLYQNNEIDISDNSFWCKLVLKDVYGGQTTPINFSIDVFPLSASFSEGLGRDNSYFSDNDSANWLSSSFEIPWNLEGCEKDTDSWEIGDYITGSVNITSTKVSQVFKSGEEDLSVDVTNFISATLTNELPDEGFRISFSKDVEDNKKTYFVKRFGSRTIFDENKRPKLIFGYDDSISDDSQNLKFDEPGTINFYNYYQSNLSNILSASQQLTGSNCMELRLEAIVSGSHSLNFSGSQLYFGSNPATGIYTADIFVDSNNVLLKNHITSSGSLNFIPIWTSLDKTVTFLTGSTLTIYQPNRSASRSSKQNVISIINAKKEYHINDVEDIRVNIFDYSDPYIKQSKKSIESKGSVIKKCYYSVREVPSNTVVIPFDDVKNSTKISSDSSGMFFKLDFSNLVAGKNYVIDIMTYDQGIKKHYADVSPIFRVTNYGR